MKCKYCLSKQIQPKMSHVFLPKLVNRLHLMSHVHNLCVLDKSYQIRDSILKVDNARLLSNLSLDRCISHFNTVLHILRKTMLSYNDPMQGYNGESYQVVYCHQTSWISVLFLTQC